MNRFLGIISSVGRALGPVVGWMEVQRNRRRIYGAAVLALPLLTSASLLSDGQAQRILATLALLAGAGVPALARKHTPKRVAGARRQDGSIDLLLLLDFAILLGVLLLLFRVHFR